MEFGLLEQEEEGRVVVTDLDAWFANIYQYWYRKGLATMIVSGLAHIVTLLFTILFSFFLLALVDWGAVVTCRDEASCGTLGRYVRTDFLVSGRGRDGLGLAYLCVFGLYWVWSCAATANSLRDAYDASVFYASELGLGDREVRSARWNDVVERLGDLQRSGRAPWHAFQTAVGRRGADERRRVLSPHDVACRIMRKDNYLVAMLNAGILALELPLPSRLAGRYRLLDALAGRLRLTKTLEWSLHVCILDHPKADDAASLRRRFVIAGLVHVALMPFLAAFMSMRFFLMNAQEWRDNKRYLGPREWSPVARWSFRELNELPHLFEARLAASKPHADAYLRMFPRPVLETVARTVAFFSGALVATLVALAAAVDDAVLLYVTVGDRNLLWYAGAASACLAVARSLGGASNADATPAGDKAADDDYEAAMAKVADFTHCFPEEWRAHCHTSDVRDAFARAFRYKFWLFADEIASVVLAPLVLCFSLPRCAPDVVHFIQENTVEVDGFGPVLGHSLFDFDRYGDPRYGGAPPGSDTHPTVSGKMEKSFLNFKLAHPEWDAHDARADTFVQHVQGMLDYTRARDDDIILEEENAPPRRRRRRRRRRARDDDALHLDALSLDALRLSFERLDACASTTIDSSFPRSDPSIPAETELV
ncbi:hypothetical protein CTAYLR_010244 [Chrysophaeum taylorii]|uniref:Autophagy-related protein 9 n=1 Tax=Chrysophaeum taylorii TaxID=2483200 RepID=A0AAD7UB92_9STRA|nr:hypothetical protein CTAYLR_010244 [Chrysophaeum taylorii]